MRIVVSSFCLFLLTVTFGIAGIEKSYDQCISLYGEPVGGKDDTWVFFAGDLVYVCDFDDKKVCKGMMATTQSKLPLTKAEIQLVLDTNPFGGTWTLQQGSDSRWTHSSGKWMAAQIRGDLTIQRP